MIISASRRTDIPAFFSDWFYNRIAEGYLLVRNPFNRHQISWIDLSPEAVDCIVFWTKNPARMMGKILSLADYTFYFHYTLNGYGKILEPNVPLWMESIDNFKNLSQIIGKDRIIWRYDPIVLNKQFNIKYHAKMFEQIAYKLSGKTRRCVISFFDMYRKVRQKMASVPVVEILIEQMIELAAIIDRISSLYGIEVTSCAEAVDLTEYGIEHGRCIDDQIISEISGFPLNVMKDPGQRTECGCVASVDVGSYNTCVHECLYCYANFNHNLVWRNYNSHDPKSPFLFGCTESEDKIYSRKAAIHKKIQK